MRDDLEKRLEDLGRAIGSDDSIVPGIMNRIDEEFAEKPVRTETLTNRLLIRRLIMILSAQQIFSDDQAVTATAISTNVIDLGAPGTPYDAAAALNQDIGKGCPIPVLVQLL